MTSKPRRLHRLTRYAGPLAALALSWLAAPLALATGPDLGLYAELLETHTRPVDDLAGTRVNYARLQSEPKWKRLIAQLEASNPSTLYGRSERLAYWINAYNILAIHKVLEGYPVASIRDLGSFFSPVWKSEAATINGKVYTLHEIEHEILRPMKDPRIHAAIVCASTSCPSLSRVPFTADNIDAELSAAFQDFVANRGKGMRIDRAKGEIVLSKIFDWFDDDWDVQGGVVRAITADAPPADRPWLVEHGDSASIDYFDYDWLLNDTTPPGKRR